MSIWSGVPQDVHGKWVEYVREQNTNPSKFFALLESFPRAYPINLLKSGIQHFMGSYGFEKDFLPGLPPMLASEFKKVAYYQPGEVIEATPTLFNILDRKKVRWQYYWLGKLDATQIQKFSSNDAPVKILFTDILDKLGHKLGPDLHSLRRVLGSVDSFIEQLVTKSQKEYPDLHVLVFSDHGMTTITELLDLEKLVKSLDLELGRDYLAFYDSTVARFWFSSAAAETKVVDFLKTLKLGRVLSEDDLRTLRIDFADKRRYGQTIFLANPGVYVYPNYFHCSLPRYFKGTHGYDPENPTTQGIVVYDGPATLTLGRTPGIIDLLPTMLDIIGMPKPCTCEGASLVNNQSDKKQ